mmetsp:Transcript_40634/g.128457  ORF Transcript_40634/g.128457 Transcript_40634/m.128457 type:complete len:336 (-) Transcript_40634:1625-2632(-)
MAEEHGAQLEESERELRADAAGDVAAAPERKTLALDTCMGLAAQESEQPQRDTLVKALQFCQVANAAALAELEAAVEARKQALKAEVAEARRSAKLEENELKRRLREEERLSRREDKRRRREAEAASRRDAALTSPASAARKESWAVAAARKGLPVGGRVEGPLDGEGSHDGSWFAGSVIDVPEKGRARVLFDRTPAAPSSAGADASKTTGVLLPLEALRPLPPPHPRQRSPILRRRGLRLPAVRPAWRQPSVRRLRRAATRRRATRRCRRASTPRLQGCTARRSSATRPTRSTTPTAPPPLQRYTASQPRSPTPTRRRGCGQGGPRRTCGVGPL